VATALRQPRLRRRGLVERVDHYQRRHRWLGYPVAVVLKFVGDQVNHLAALITYHAPHRD
jgi:membrane protein